MLFRSVVWPAALTFNSNTAYYGSYACNVTISWRAKCTPTDRLDGLLDDKDGAEDFKDFVAAVLNKNRWQIAKLANARMDSTYDIGAYNGLTESPRVLSIGNWEPKYADWWGEAAPATQAVMNQWSRLEGYACTIVFGQGGLIQHNESATG